MIREVGLLSVVAPMYEEEDTVDPFTERVAAALGDLNYELILVNDGSKDGTRDAMAAAAARDPRVKIVSLARNFGHQPALTAGLEHARGDVIVMLDGDLQDPPEVIPEMLDALARGDRRRLRRARAAAGGDRVQARHRARLLPHVPPPHRPRSRRRVRRLPPDGPQGARRAAGDARAQPLPARDDGLDRLHADRGAVRAPGAPRGRHQVPAAQDAAVQLRRDHVVLAAGRCSGRRSSASSSASSPSWRSR